MAERGSSLREVLDRIAAELASAGNLQLDEARSLVDQLAHRWRGDVVRAGERLGQAADGVFHDLGLVTRDDFLELELRVAQLEHRLRLLEDGAASAGATSSGDRRPLQS
jgi:polyhydroxyalkanoate synthesis regulator phasin